MLVFNRNIITTHYSDIGKIKILYQERRKVHFYYKTLKLYRPI